MKSHPFLEIILESNKGFIGLFDGGLEEEGLREGIKEALVDDGVRDSMEIVLDIGTDDDLFSALEGIDANAGAAGEGGATDDADEFVGLIDDEAEVLKGRNGAAEDAVDVFGFVDTSLDGAQFYSTLGITEDMSAGLRGATRNEKKSRCKSEYSKIGVHFNRDMSYTAGASKGIPSRNKA